MEGSQYVADYYRFNGVYLPEDLNKGEYLTLWGIASGIDYRSMYQKYCFRRVVCYAGSQVDSVTAAGFSIGQVIVAIGWQDDSYLSVVAQYGSQVLGYMIDEPSGNAGYEGIDYNPGVSYDRLNTIKSNIPAGKLWLDDYDTKVISISLTDPTTSIANGYHPANQTVLELGDFIWNDGNTSKWLDGDNTTGINALIYNYNEFQYWFGQNFNGILCKPMDGSGALLNDETMWDWLNNHSNCNNFVLYLSSDFTNAWPAALNNFMTDADRAGFLGHQYQVYYYTYVCQTNSVKFTPPGAPEAGAGRPAYYGVWTNNAYYMGPVDPSTPGAVFCWAFQSAAATSQTVNVY